MDAAADRRDLRADRVFRERLEAISLSTAMRSATHAPEIDAVRVPPSAWMTSQSTMIWRSPSLGRSTTARRLAADQALDFLRPSRLLALGGLAIATRVRRAREHAVFGGDPTLALAAQKGRHLVLDRCGHSTRVSPKLTRHEPSAWRVKPGSKLEARAFGRVRGRMGASFLLLVDSVRSPRPGGTPILDAAGNGRAYRRADRPDARDLRPRCRGLSRARHARGLEGAHGYDELVACLDPRRDAGAGRAGAAHASAYFGRAHSDRSGPETVRRRHYAGRRSPIRASGARSSARSSATSRSRMRLRRPRRRCRGFRKRRAWFWPRRAKCG